MSRVVIRFTVAAVLAAVVTSCGSTAGEPSSKPSEDGLHLSNFTVLDDSYKYWSVGSIQEIKVQDGGDSLAVYSENGPNDCAGIVGYALEWRQEALIVRLVGGQRQEFCELIGVPNTLIIPLDRPLDGRSVVPQPQRDVNAEVARP